MTQPPRIQSLANHGLLITFGEEIDIALSQRLARLRERVATLNLADVDDIVPAYTTLMLIGRMNPERQTEIGEQIAALWEDPALDDVTGHPPREVVIPVVYGGEHGPDLAHIAAHTGLAPDEVIQRHQAAEYTVATLGFAPGFAYLGGLPPELTIPRRAAPRTRVPAGSVAIGGGQTGVYSLETPGGWNILGRTALPMFDPLADEPSRLQPGDRVRFQAVPSAIFPVAKPEPKPIPSPRDLIEVVKPGLQTTVQDAGRLGLGRFGVAPNGAADQASWRLGNTLLCNHPGAAGLEVTGTGLHLRFLRSTRFVVTGADLGAVWNGMPLPVNAVRVALPGDEIRFEPGTQRSGWRAYLMVSGGIDVPMVLGSRSTDLSARFGGFRGRPLRSGDRLAGGSSTIIVTKIPSKAIAAGPIRVMRGPQADRFSEDTWQRFVTGSFTVSSQSNRMGVRLDGPRLLPETSADIVSEGMVTGAVQVTGEGQPIVMLPGRTTVGGYAKIAIVIADDLDRLGQLAPGDTVRFLSV